MFPWMLLQHVSFPYNQKLCFYFNNMVYATLICKANLQHWSVNNVYNNNIELRFPTLKINEKDETKNNCRLT